MYIRRVSHEATCAAGCALHRTSRSAQSGCGLHTGDCALHRAAAGPRRDPQAPSNISRAFADVGDAKFTSTEMLARIEELGKYL